MGRIASGSRPSNAAMVERLVRVIPGITRPELAEALDLSITTVNPLVLASIGKGRLAEQPGSRRSPGAGRPRNGLRVAGRAASIGFVSWTHGILRGAVCTFDGRLAVVSEERINRAAAVPLAADVIRLAESVMRTETGSVGAPEALVLSVPAPYEHGLKAPALYSRRFPPQAAGRWFEDEPRYVLRGVLGCPVLIENDSNLSALGEANSGAGRDSRVVVYVRLSDRGVGSGLILDGEPMEGADGLAGEIAHVQVAPASNQVCSCGSRGCLRTILGVRLLEPLQAEYGVDLDYTELLRLAEAGEPGPIRVLRDAGIAIGHALAAIVNFVNPDAVVVEAGSPSASHIVSDGIFEQVSRSSPPFIMENFNLTSARLGTTAMNIGALLLARRRAIGDREISRRVRLAQVGVIEPAVIAC